MKETDLIQAISQGDQGAFKSLYNATSTNVYNTALGYAQDTKDAEEITQLVYIKIHKYAHSFQGNSTINTWVYRITVNASLDFLKKRNRFSFMNTSLTNQESPDFEHPGIILEKKEEGKALFSVIKGLPKNQKTAFILSYVEDLPRQEVADIMEVSLKAVESLLQRAKSNLRIKLKNSYTHRRKK